MAHSAEDFERHVVNVLQENLQAALDVTSAAYLTQDRQDGLADPDGTSWVVLDAPVRTQGAPSGFGDYYPGGIDIVAAWPSIEVAVPDENIDNFSLGQIDADVTVDLIIRLWLKHGNFAVLNRMMKRYAATVTEVLKAPSALGDSSIQRIRRAYRTNPELRDENDRLQSGVLLFLTLDTGLIRA